MRASAKLTPAGRTSTTTWPGPGSSRSTSSSSRLSGGPSSRQTTRRLAEARWPPFPWPPSVDSAPGTERQRRLHLAAAGDDEGVGEVDPGGTHVDDDLARSRLQPLDLLELEVVGRSQLTADDATHRGGA